ncbi:MAG: kynureninase [Anaerolineales bacterium]|nr:kynureninase [Anaerolineales bacterium]MCX7754758.1 kynureninase [Anaerolineales bacterium]MDW8278496.1 kynureninase [Anaerolineales bacterium]
MKNISTSRDFALSLDAADPLAHFHTEFESPDPALCYMDGNSLGRLPRRTAARLHQTIKDEWGQSLIRGWNQGWYTAPARIGDKIGKLLGADAGQVIVSDSTSVNLYKLVHAALQINPERRNIVTDNLNFPSDIYILQGIAASHTPPLEIRVFDAQSLIETELQSEEQPSALPSALSALIDEQTALVTLSHVAFKSGYLYDMAEITRQAHAKGALVLWDLSHSAGVIPIELDAWEVDFAIGCTYKYLNGGPGSPAFLYVNRRLQEQTCSPIWGWFGQNQPFDFELEYTPAPGIARFLAGTPPILSLAGVETGVEIVLEAGITAIRQKSVALTEYFLCLAEQTLTGQGFTPGSPRNPARRGSHISLRHPAGYRINRALIENMNVLPDFRAPDTIRFGLAPLYTRFLDVWETIQRLQRVMNEARWQTYSETRASVT